MKITLAAFASIALGTSAAVDCDFYVGHWPWDADCGGRYEDYSDKCLSHPMMPLRSGQLSKGKSSKSSKASKSADPSG